MQITVQLPDDIADHENPGREALEALVITGYSSDVLTSRQARILLGLETRYELDGFFKEHQVEHGAYGIKEYEQDLKTIEKIWPKIQGPDPKH
jgi:hypothetical protein